MARSPAVDRRLPDLQQRDVREDARCVRPRLRQSFRRPHRRGGAELVARQRRHHRHDDEPATAAVELRVGGLGVHGPGRDAPRPVAPRRSLERLPDVLHVRDRAGPREAPLPQVRERGADDDPGWLAFTTAGPPDHAERVAQADGRGRRRSLHLLVRRLRAAGPAHRRQRHPGRLRGLLQLPLRPRQRARVLRRPGAVVRERGHRDARGEAPRPEPQVEGHVRHRARRAAGAAPGERDRRRVAAAERRARRVSQPPSSRTTASGSCSSSAARRSPRR